MESADVIVSALAAGAKAALSDTAKQAVKDAYSALATAIKRKFDSVDITPVENKPESKDRRKLVADELVAVGADQDLDVIEAATRLLDFIEQHAPEAGRAVGVSITEAKARGIDVSNILASGPNAAGVVIKWVETIEDIRISNVGVRAAEDHPQNP